MTADTISLQHAINTSQLQPTFTSKHAIAVHCLFGVIFYLPYTYLETAEDKEHVRLNNGLSLLM